MNVKEKYRICFFSLSYDLYTGADFNLDEIPTQKNWIEMLNELGYESIIVTGGEEAKQIEFTNTKIFVLPCKKLKNKGSLDPLYISQSAELIQKEKIDLVHCHNLDDALSHGALKKKLGTRIKLIVQDHGSVVRWWHFFLIPSFRRLNGLVFNNRGLEKKWLKNFILQKRKIKFIQEDYSSFSYQDRQTSRNVTGLSGGRIFLWVGNLNRNKDPLTLVTAFAKLNPKLNDYKLYLVYRETELETNIITFIKNNKLEHNVHLLGPVKKEEIELVFNSADYFVLGSGKEGSGYSVMEAMSCGVIPVLSRIPSFEYFTDYGKLGALFIRGSIDSCYQALLTVLTKPIDIERQKVLKHFEENLSRAAVKKQIEKVYSQFINE